MLDDVEPPHRPTLKYVLPPALAFLFFAILAAWIAAGWSHRLGSDFPAGRMFVGMVAGPFSAFDESFAIGVQILLALPTIGLLWLNIQTPSSGTSLLASLGVTWWFFWGFAISHIGV